MMRKNWTLRVSITFSNHIVTWFHIRDDILRFFVVQQFVVLRPVPEVAP